PASLDTILHQNGPGRHVNVVAVRQHVEVSVKLLRVDCGQNSLLTTAKLHQFFNGKAASLFRQQSNTWIPIALYVVFRLEEFVSGVIEFFEKLCELFRIDSQFRIRQEFVSQNDFLGFEFAFLTELISIDWIEPV